MFGRIADTIVTRLLPHVRECVRKELDAREDAGRREVRELVREMEDVLEKLTLQAARESKRRSRAAKEAIQEPASEEIAARLADSDQHGTASVAGLPGNRYRAQLYAQFGHMLHRRT